MKILLSNIILIIMAKAIPPIEFVSALKGGVNKE